MIKFLLDNIIVIIVLGILGIVLCIVIFVNDCIQKERIRIDKENRSSRWI